MTLDVNALNLISLFNSHNHAAYAVGGCVRDAVMGRACNDTDIAVSCTPDVTVSVLAQHNIRYVGTGLKHGTVTAVIDRIPYEITTFRTDGEYTDSRHPDSVSFVTSIEADLSRRDFTVNAMAYSPGSGIVDLFGGVDDIKARVIRTVGDPDKRFAEDALRILRALRFSSTLCFDIEQDTADSIVRNHGSLKNVARERITAEMEKLLLGENVTSVITRFYDVFCSIFDTDSLDAAAVDSYPCDFALRLAALTDGHTLVLSNAVRHRVRTVRANAELALPEDLAAARRMLFEFGLDDTRDILTFRHADSALSLVASVISQNLPYSIAQLDINGADLVAAGLRGAQIKNALNSALFAVIDGKVDNVNKNLLDYIGTL